jgi:alpha-galactosidase
MEKPNQKEMDYAAIVTADEMQDKDVWLAPVLQSLRQPPASGRRTAAIEVVKQGWGSLQVGRSVFKTPLCLQGKQYANGFGTHADSVIRIQLPDAGVRLTGLAGVDDSPHTRINSKAMVFSVEAEGRELWRSGSQTVTDAPALLDVALNGARELVLRVTGSVHWAHANWVDLEATLADGTRLPLARTPGAGDCFSFAYGERPSADLWWNWPVIEDSSSRATDWILHRIVRQDPATKLAVQIEVKEYTAFPAVEWMLRFRNAGERETPILADIRSMDIALPAEGLLHYQSGDWVSPDAYQPQQAMLTPGTDLAFAPTGGRPTHRAWPYYNLEYAEDRRGVIAVVGWAGQWASRFQATLDRIRISAGQADARFKLLPGEEVRTPLSVLLFWRGDRVRSQNLWRRWMMACNMPRVAGGLPPPMLPASACPHFAEMALATTENQCAFIDRYLAEGIRPDYWWMDAGWYPCGGQWQNVGTWEPDRERFPKGLHEISDYARSKGMRAILWFEPERVYRGSWLAVNHPEWLLRYDGGDVNESLLDLGNPVAWNWLVEHVSRTIQEQGVDLYRQDFNLDPLAFWRAHDAPDRQGLTEIRYVEGYLAYWSELRRRFPDMVIDSCSSGGRRNDLETMRLGVPLHKTDYPPGDAAAKQAFHHSLAQWIPFFGAAECAAGPGVIADDYAFRSSLAMSTALTEDLRRGDVDWRRFKQLTDEWRRVTETGCFYGDFYPLTDHTRSESHSLAWQFHRPDRGQGVVQLFRRKESPFVAARVRLRGLEAVTIYRVTDMDEPDRIVEMSGRELEEAGLSVEMPRAPQAKVFVYNSNAVARCEP